MLTFHHWELQDFLQQYLPSVATNHMETHRAVDLIQKEKKHTCRRTSKGAVAIWSAAAAPKWCMQLWMSNVYVTANGKGGENQTLTFNVSVTAPSKLFFSRKPSSPPSAQYASSNIRSSPYWRLWENGDHRPICSSWSAKKKTNMGKTPFQKI